MAIKAIDIVCHTHTDFGYTDYPLKARALLKSHIGLALDAAEKTAHLPEQDRFHWTCEVLLPVWDWWQDASETDRARLLKAVDNGQIEIMGLPFNVTAFLNEDEWDHMMRWIPKELWDRMHICSAIQNDVNGLHTGGIGKAYDAGIRNIWIGANTYNGAPPVPTPALVDWKLDEDRTVRMWVNASYCDGYFLLQENWRQGPVPNSTDLRYREPMPGDFFKSDEESVRAAHKYCLGNIAAIEGPPDTVVSAARDGFTQNKVFGGYTGEVLAVSLTNQWRIDNDPPCPWVSDFVHTWNRLGLQPELRLRTTSQAIAEVAEGWKKPVEVLSGEWVDWWANGTASSPAELAYSRKAKRNWKTAQAAVLGPWDERMQACSDKVLENLCRYDEHTYGAWQSIAYPDSFEAKAQRAEKDIFAYRALSYSEDLLTMRAVHLEKGLKNAIKIVNPTTQDRVFDVRLPQNCLRGDYRSFTVEATGERFPITYTRGISNFMRPKVESDFSEENVSRTFCDYAPGQTALVSVLVPAMGEAVLRLSEEACGTPAKQTVNCDIKTDAMGWPTYVRLGTKLLVNGTAGDFQVLTPDGFSPRWTLRDIFDTEDFDTRRKLFREHTQLTGAVYQDTVRTETDTSITFEQSFCHGSLRYGKRMLTIQKANGTAELTVRFYRNSNLDPELYYVTVDAPGTSGETYVSNCGKAFRPGADQLPGSCMDYYAIDNWVYRGTKERGWMISSRDAALVTFGEPTQPSRRQTMTDRMDRMLFQLFDNTWDTNFNANAFGTMEFTFDITSGIALADCAEISQNMAAEPIVIVRTGF